VSPTIGNARPYAAKLDRTVPRSATASAASTSVRAASEKPSARSRTRVDLLR
jgi:hypothetical protein